MNGELNKIFEALGRLSAEVSGLREDMKEAAESRANVHKRLDRLSDRTTAVEGNVKTLLRDFEEVERITKKVSDWEQRGIGALFVVGLASASISASLVYFWSTIVRAINRTVF